MSDYQELEDQLRCILPNESTSLILSFNHHLGEQEDPTWAYEGYLWPNPDDRKSGIDVGSVWTANVYGHGVKHEIAIAGSSLKAVIQELLGYADINIEIACALLTEELRGILPNDRIAINLSFNRHAGNNEDPIYEHENFWWSSEEDFDQAIRTQSIWGVEIFGRGIEPSVSIAASTFKTAIDMLKATKHVIHASQRREPSKKMSQRQIANMLMRSQQPPTFVVERIKRPKPRHLPPGK